MGGVVDDSNAVPYILGVSSTAVAVNDRFIEGVLRHLPADRRLRRLSDLPTDGVFNYTLLGDTGIVSTKDYKGDLVPLGNVSDAHAAIDFKNGTGQLDLSVTVRRTAGTIHLALEAQNKILGFASGAQSLPVPCKEGGCPEATVWFYGRDAEFLGVIFSYADATLLPEAAWVAARLNIVGSQGAVVLRRSGN